ncbi:plasmid partitioning protein, partial [Mesorhizobium sp. M4B.F.Ca.ET.089.01.1.1]|uniref:plasmid partitioning protein n=1 Tax=Mesorhizobium sp. M4B.F.Ca.ET.089.01.1.1 TaxID=2496662 RepID=UPI000FE3253A
ARGDMPNEGQLRTIASASLDEQKEVWKKHKPSKADPQVSWWSVAQGLTKTRMYARDASFGDDLAQAYGIAWVEDLFAPADEDSRYTIDVEAFLGAQQEWMTNNLPRKGVLVEVNGWGQPELPKKAERLYGKPGKGDHTGMYLDRDGKVQTVHYRMPDPKPAAGKTGAVADGSNEAEEDVGGAKSRPEVTQKGHDMIGDFRTDALHEALARAPIEDDMLMALMVIAFAGQNVRVDSGANDHVFGPKRFKRHVARLFTEDGRFSFDMERVRVAARSMLVEVLSCRRGMSNSGVVSRIAGEAIGADGYLPNMGTEDFLACLSRQALEAAASGADIQPRPRVRETRSALVEHFKAEATFVHPAALFAPDPLDIADLMRQADDADEHGAADDAGGDSVDAAPIADVNFDDTDIADEHGATEPELVDADIPEDTSDGLAEEHSAYGIAAE